MKKELGKWVSEAYGTLVCSTATQTINYCTGNEEQFEKSRRRPFSTFDSGVPVSARGLQSNEVTVVVIEASIEIGGV